MRNIGIIWKQSPSSEANIKIQIQNAKHDLPRTQLARPREGGNVGASPPLNPQISVYHPEIRYSINSQI